MAAIAIVLYRLGNRPTQDVALKFIEHFAAIRDAMENQGLWDDVDGLFYDRLVTPDGHPRTGEGPLHGRDHPGVGLPRSSTAPCCQNVVTMNKDCSPDSWWLRPRRHGRSSPIPAPRAEGAGQRPLLSVARLAQLERLFAKLFDEREFLSPYGLRALSAFHLDIPTSSTSKDSGAASIRTGGVDHAHVRRELRLAGPALVPGRPPGSRGAGCYYRFFRDAFEIEYPAGSGQQLPLGLISPTCETG